MADGGSYSERQMELILEFMKVTGVDGTRATALLEAYNWNFDVAVYNFFDDPEEANNAPSGEQQPCERERDVSVRDETHLAKKVKQSTSATAGSSVRSFSVPHTDCIATLSSLKRKEESKHANPEEEEGQAFYAGGSVNSGQQVLGPSKKRQDGTQIAKEMFKAAVSRGAEVLDSPNARSDTPRIVAFRGVGHVLGSSTDDSGRTVSSVSQSAEQDQPIEVQLKAWRNGFSVDGGPLREYTDPRNRSFLDAVRHGKLPQELVNKASDGREIHLSMEDCSHEDYKPQKQSLQAFTGTGFRLGSPTPPVAAVQSEAEGQSNINEAERYLNVNEAEPTTMLQVRLADGSKLVLKLNHTHTLNDVRRYIVTARPEYSVLVFSLMTSYPRTELVDDNLTVKEANLLNSVIVQRLR